MKINSNSNYIIFENKLQQFMLKDAEDFILEIHYHTSQNEIIGIITYLKQNINEIAKKIHNTNYNVSEIGISNTIASKYIKDEILEPNKLDQRNITIILPHDGRNRHDAIETLVSREKAYKDAGFKVQVLSQVDVNEAIETTRAAIQHHELIFAKNNNIEEFISFLKEYEWKINKLTGENAGIPNHGINISASNSADSLEYMAITFFFKKKIDKSAYSKSQIQRLGRDY